ncbi:hypothetical protein Q8A64_17225 [Oxalobacteraceae bacterium R-40]|uniref:Pentapeptide MXKDX repeat protein n=1 Tax=Keguizhuia sedimenti TaxID=3064264 RepID=A0ABU1BT21_9BURK|nr:hypothetical protein [Oxalobacteraceae bacterium R-40]
MKKLVLIVAGFASMAAALPASAGPDMQLIEKGRQAKKEQQMKQRNQTEQMMKACAEMMKKSS